MKTLANPLYTLILSLISWVIFLYLIFPGPFEFGKIITYAVFTMGIFPALFLITLAQMVVHRFKNTYGWLSIFSALLAGAMLIKYINTGHF
jgi:hypothetical protein